jgi:hypothetical protein
MTAPVTTVRLLPPTIAGDTVTFAWEATPTLRHQTGSAFWFRYEGIDLAWFAQELFLEIFLALELRVLATQGGPVRLILPSPVPAPVADFWRGYNDAWNVDIAPISAATTYDPWAASPSFRPRRHRRAVFFGGGKDSTLVSQIWREADGADEVLLVRGIYFTEPARARLESLHDRTDRLILAPNRASFGFASACYWTSYPPSVAPPARPHLELHSAGALPLLLAHGVETAAFCRESGSYLTTISGDESPLRPTGMRSSPEWLASQSRHYQQRLGVPLEITNPVWPASYSAVYHTLARRYPDAARQTVSCPQIEGHRWCMTCSKCDRSFGYLMGAGIDDPGYDYTHALSRGPYNTRVLSFIPDTLVPRTNLRWADGMPPGSMYFAEWCDNIARIDPDAWASRLSPAAFANLLRLKASFGNTRCPQSLQVSRTALDRLPTSVRETFAPVYRSHLDPVDDTPDYRDPAGVLVRYPWHLPVTIPPGMPT